MRRRIICVVLAVVLLLGTLTVTFAFEDDKAHWATNEIERAAELGLFLGADDAAFDPDAPMTRAMFVTVLGRLAGIEPLAWQCDYLGLLFTDVDSDADYAPYVAWAVHYGIANGVGERRFEPEQAVSRQQMAHLLVNYLAVYGITLSDRMPELSSAAEPTEDLPVPEDTELSVILPEPSSTEQTPVEDAAAESGAVSGLGLRTRPRDTAPLERKTQLAQTGPSDAERKLSTLYSDAAQIGAWAQPSVLYLAERHLLTGMADGSGGCRFAPADSATCAECAVLLCRVLDAMSAPATAQTLPVSVMLDQTELTLDAGCSGSLLATVFPYDAANAHVVWYSDTPEVATVAADGTVTAHSAGSACIYAVSCNGLMQGCKLVVNEAPKPIEVPAVSDGALGCNCMRSSAKDLMIFGQEVADPRTFYADDEEALSHQTVIAVKTWDLAEDGTKYTRVWGLQIHENIAPTVQAIFDEIYALPEKPPIHSLGGWRPEAGVSEHQPGLAIDINWLENYYCDPEGNAITGYYFMPDEDPYSIPIGGAVDQIFNKYGFTRGVYWNSGYRDYMHYSFYGT